MTKEKAHIEATNIKSEGDSRGFWTKLNYDSRFIDHRVQRFVEVTIRIPYEDETKPVS